MAFPGRPRGTGGSGSGATGSQIAQINANTQGLQDANNATQAELDAQIARITALESNPVSGSNYTVRVI